MIRNKRVCPSCGASISLSNFTKHEASRSCLYGGKNRSKPVKHPWDDWRVGEDMYSLPCGYSGTKRACTNKLISAGLIKNGESNFRSFHESVRLGKRSVHNKGKRLSDEQKRKLSVAGKKHHQKHKMPIEERKRISEKVKRRLMDNPHLHPNVLVSGNRSKMTYPERVAHDWFKRFEIDAKHNQRIGRYFPDFVVEKVIVEIDGERWHSSPSQIAHDKRRDSELRSMGYIVHRIPAKSRIEDALAAIFLSNP